jgi:hypothetical protein
MGIFQCTHVCSAAAPPPGLTFYGAHTMAGFGAHPMAGRGLLRIPQCGPCARLASRGVQPSARTLTLYVSIHVTQCPSCAWGRFTEATVWMGITVRTRMRQRNTCEFKDVCMHAFTYIRMPSYTYMYMHALYPKCIQQLQRMSLRDIFMTRPRVCYTQHNGQIFVRLSASHTSSRIMWCF